MTNPTQALTEAARVVLRLADDTVEAQENPHRVERGVECPLCMGELVEPQDRAAMEALRAGLLHQDEAQRREDACFECGAELHAPFCPACNPEMVRPSPSWPSKEEIARVIDPRRWWSADERRAHAEALTSSGDRYVWLHFDEARERAPSLAKADAILALFAAPTQDKTP